MKLDESWSDAIVDRAEDLSPTVRSIELRPADGVRSWTVGSHMRVQVSVDGRSEVRSYSLVGLPGESRADGVYRIAVKRAEPGRGGSRFMHRLRAGDRIAIAGPDNHFELPPPGAQAAPHVLLLAGGIGITPICGMALTLAARGATLRLLYGARDDSELVFAERLRAVLGDRLQTFSDARGERFDLAAEIAALPPRALLLVCGPAPLLQAVQAAWAKAGRPAADLRFETFGSSGSRPAEPFRVRVPRQGVDVVVPADRSLLDVLSDNGVEALYDCRRGECGLCAMDIVSVQGEVDHRDVFFSAEEKRDNRRLCVCVSRVCGGEIVLDSAWRPDALPAPTHAVTA
jgi:vanillate O-demethylase ferredoxin subunit